MKNNVGQNAVLLREERLSWSLVSSVAYRRVYGHHSYEFDSYEFDSYEFDSFLYLILAVPMMK